MQNNALLARQARQTNVSLRTRTHQKSQTHAIDKGSQAHQHSTPNIQTSHLLAIMFPCWTNSWPTPSTFMKLRLVVPREGKHHDRQSGPASNMQPGARRSVAYRALLGKVMDMQLPLTYMLACNKYKPRTRNLAQNWNHEPLESSALRHTANRSAPHQSPWIASLWSCVSVPSLQVFQAISNKAVTMLCLHWNIQQKALQSASGQRNQRGGSIAWGGPQANFGIEGCMCILYWGPCNCNEHLPLACTNMATTQSWSQLNYLSQVQAFGAWQCKSRCKSDPRSWKAMAGEKRPQKQFESCISNHWQNASEIMSYRYTVSISKCHAVISHAWNMHCPLVPALEAKGCNDIRATAKMPQALAQFTHGTCLKRTCSQTWLVPSISARTAHMPANLSATQSKSNVSTTAQLMQKKMQASRSSTGRPACTTFNWNSAMNGGKWKRQWQPWKQKHASQNYKLNRIFFHSHPLAFVLSQELDRFRLFSEWRRDPPSRTGFSSAFSSGFFSCPASAGAFAVGGGGSRCSAPSCPWSLLVLLEPSSPLLLISLPSSSPLFLIPLPSSSPLLLESLFLETSSSPLLLGSFFSCPRLLALRRLLLDRDRERSRGRSGGWAGAGSGGLSSSSSTSSVSSGTGGVFSAGFFVGNTCTAFPGGIIFAFTGGVAGAFEAVRTAGTEAGFGGGRITFNLLNWSGSSSEESVSRRRCQRSCGHQPPSCQSWESHSLERHCDCECQDGGCGSGFHSQPSNHSQLMMEPKTLQIEVIRPITHEEATKTISKHEWTRAFQSRKNPQRGSKGGRKFANMQS